MVRQHTTKETYDEGSYSPHDQAVIRQRRRDQHPIIPFMAIP
jgi:hypothetical protein